MRQEAWMPYKYPSDQAAAARRHYNANREKISLRARKATAKKREAGLAHIDNYLRNHPCVDCGESDRVVLEFDHVRGKKVRDVTKMCHDGYALESIKLEIEKCEVRCANCHRRVTHRRREKLKRLSTAGASS